MIRLLRPWITWNTRTMVCQCHVCIFNEKSNLLMLRGKAYYWVFTKRCRNRAGVARFFRQHRNCAPHRW